MLCYVYSSFAFQVHSANTRGQRPAVQAKRPIRLALPLLLVAGLGFALLHYSGHLDAVSCSCVKSHAAPVCQNVLMCCNIQVGNVAGQSCR